MRPQFSCNIKHSKNIDRNRVFFKHGMKNYDAMSAELYTPLFTDFSRGSYKIDSIEM